MKIRYYLRYLAWIPREFSYRFWNGQKGSDGPNMSKDEYDKWFGSQNLKSQNNTHQDISLDSKRDSALKKRSASETKPNLDGTPDDTHILNKESQDE